MTIDKQALRADAVRAGGVKWQYMRATQHSKAYITDETGSTVINCTDGDVPAKCAGFLTSANPATVLALLDELEAAEKRIAELEARTVTLPDERFRYGESDYDDGYANGWNAHGIETKSALQAAGIGVKGG